jgi:hypothetical protein
MSTPNAASCCSDVFNTLANDVFLVTSTMFLVGSLTFGDELKLAFVDVKLSRVELWRILGLRI